MTTNDEWVNDTVLRLMRNCSTSLSVEYDAVDDARAALQEAIERTRAEERANAKKTAAMDRQQIDELKAFNLQALRLAHEMQDKAVEKAREEDGEWCRALLRVVQTNPGFDWRDYDDGITADQAAQFLIDDLDEAWSQQDKAVAALEAENKRLRENHTDIVRRKRSTAKKRDEFEYRAHVAEARLARLENPDEALVEALVNAMAEIDFGPAGARYRNILRALARTLTEGQEGESKDG